MLRVETQESDNIFVAKLEGRFSGNDAVRLGILVAYPEIEKGRVVDLTDATFIDSVGEVRLSFLSRLGANFVAEDAFMLDMCEPLHLSLARRPPRW